MGPTTHPRTAVAASSGDAGKAVANAKICSTIQGLQVISHLSELLGCHCAQ